MCDHHLGNFVLSLPTIRKLSTFFCRGIDLLVDARHTPLALHILPGDRIISLNQGVSNGDRSLARFLATAGVVLRTAARRYAMVIDLTGSIVSTTVTLASCSRKRVGFFEAGRSWIYAHRISKAAQSYTPFRYAQILTLLGESPEVSPIKLRASASEHEQCDQLLQALGLDLQRPVVVVHPKTARFKRRYRLRCWPEERFAELAARLAGHFEQQVCLIGSPYERQGLDRIRGAAGSKKGIVSFVAPVNILLALLEKGTVLISNEGGPTHLAGTTHIPIVTVFGPTAEAIWRPFRTQDIVLLRGAECAPACLRSGGPCAGRSRALCVENISVDGVLKSGGSLSCETFRCV